MIGERCTCQTGVGQQHVVRGLRILMFCSYFPPEYSGAALQAITLSRQLRRMGHYVEFVTERWPGLAAEGEFDGFRVTRLEGGRGTKHREIRLWWNLYRFLRRNKKAFDFLHTHGAYYKNAIAGPFAKLFGMKSLAKASLANNDLRYLGRTLPGRIHLAMLRQVDVCIAISHDLEREFIAGGVAASQVQYLPNCVDLERFFPPDPHERSNLRDRYGLPQDKRIILYVGVFDQRKNIAWLIRSWLHNEGFGLNALLLAIGPRSREDPTGAFKQQMVRYAHENPGLLRIEDEVTEVADYYRAADAFIMPSLSEGLPNAVLEAMACALPCIAADVSGTRELVEDGDTGLLFPPHDAERLGAGLRRALSVSGGSLGDRARRRVEENFSLEEVAQRYVGLYRSVARAG